MAKAEYEMLEDVMLEEVGFAIHPRIAMFGASPDAFVGKVGMCEFKAPLPHTHLRYLLDGVIPEDYEPQMLSELACCPEREWNDFVSYCPSFPKDLQIFKRRMKRDDAKISELEKGVEEFLDSVTIEMGNLALLGDLTPILQESVKAATMHADALEG